MPKATEAVPARPSAQGPGAVVARGKCDGGDPLLAALLERLSQAGHKASAACQGRTSLEDVDHSRHCVGAFVTFGDPAALDGRQGVAAMLGLHVGDGGRTVRSLSGEETQLADVFEKNRAFAGKVLRLFGLAG